MSNIVGNYFRLGPVNGKPGRSAHRGRRRAGTARTACDRDRDRVRRAPRAPPGRTGCPPAPGRGRAGRRPARAPVRADSARRPRPGARPGQRCVRQAGPHPGRAVRSGGGYRGRHHERFARSPCHRRPPTSPLSSSRSSARTGPASPPGSSTPSPPTPSTWSTSSRSSPVAASCCARSSPHPPAGLRGRPAGHRAQLGGVDEAAGRDHLRPRRQPAARRRPVARDRARAPAHRRVGGRDRRPDHRDRRQHRPDLPAGQVPGDGRRVRGVRCGDRARCAPRWRPRPRRSASTSPWSRPGCTAGPSGWSSWTWTRRSSRTRSSSSSPRTPAARPRSPR